VRIARAEPGAAKGWHVGPWNAELPVSIGYANEGIDDPHVHERTTEIYLVARGTSQLRVEKTTVSLGPGDVAVIEPGEAHTFLSNSPDYLQFVAHVPGLTSAEARNDKREVPRVRLGL
jgi:mannose-6-phosphate isomerase-like protein (cupin superfamily)